MKVILGIDAAWTDTQPTGVALFSADAVRMQCVAVAPSYETFIALARGVRVEWDKPRFQGAPCNVIQLLEAACTLANAPVDVVAVDMPVALTPITGRRVADSEISRRFGNRGCSTHSPSVTRPGQTGARLSSAFGEAGFSIATLATPAGTLTQLVEVYPHPALLALLNRPYRIPYKIARASRYFPSDSPAQRIANLLAEFRAILNALEEWLGPVALSLPAASQVRSVQHLKSYEDVLDALVCAWVGGLYLRGEAVAFGDNNAAIWCPAGVNNLPGQPRPHESN